jgi:hypothetical protein
VWCVQETIVAMKKAMHLFYSKQQNFWKEFSEDNCLRFSLKVLSKIFIFLEEFRETLP